ncbi:HvfC/BufC N-terminal domain-containing protein [Terriglobus tenax]|uniref:HvfC/BufC N-terminal domain-containing protein n=1 Tax=Terriglobus tenax TaxID=1111115 RepID=UPI0021DFD4A0|nr:DNA-binding domain-containing protein [Terriglobus tenax]
MTLLELQRRMREDVCRPLTPDFMMQQTAADGSAMHEIAASYIAPNNHLSSFERLEIYNRSYWFRAMDAVSEDFPALRAVIGDSRFEALILAYLRENPSRSWTLRNLSSRLPAWLAKNPGHAGRRHRLAIDVARLEWAYIEAFDNRLMPSLSSEDLASLGPDKTLALQPHLQLLELSYPVDELVLAVHRNAPAKDIVSNTSVTHKHRDKLSLPSIRRKTLYLAVHRFDDSVYYRRIDREAFLLLTALRDGSAIMDALQAVLAGKKQKPEYTVAKIQECFTHASELGWFCRPSNDNDL